MCAVGTGTQGERSSDASQCTREAQVTTVVGNENEWEMKMECYSACRGALQTREFSVSRIREAGGSMGASGARAMALIERVRAGAGSGVGNSTGSTGGTAKCHEKFIASDCALEATMRKESTHKTKMFNSDSNLEVLRLGAFYCEKVQFSSVKFPCKCANSTAPPQI